MCSFVIEAYKEKTMEVRTALRQFVREEEEKLQAGRKQKQEVLFKEFGVTEDDLRRVDHYFYRGSWLTL
jgi:hypothetical protein